MKPKVSILVPCYNVEKYLKQCMDSIVNQTLKDIEIIVINDGSTDSTLDIIKSYAKKDKRIKIIDKENEGYGKSMNLGLDAATGKYIGIVESDDWADTDMFEKLVKIADENNVDVAKGNYYKYTTTNGEKNIKIENLPHLYCGHVINPHCENRIFLCQPSIWSAIYRRDFLIKNNIRFLESPGASYQDLGFNFKVWAMANTAFLINDAFLHYRSDNENSSVKSSGKVFCVCDEWDEVDRYLNDYPEQRKMVSKLIPVIKLGSYMFNLNRLSDDAKQEFLTCFISEFREYVKNKDITNKYIDNKTWLKLLCIIYPKNPVYKVKYALCNILRPIYKTRVSGEYKKHYLFNKFMIKEVKL